MHLKRVQIGLDYGKRIQIVAGLKAGQRVIAHPSDQIHEGIRVLVQE